DDPVADVDAVDEPVLDERLEGAVDAREPDPPVALVQRGVDLLRAAAAFLGAEVLDHAPARRPRPVPGLPEPFLHLRRPRHRTDDNENRYRPLRARHARFG